MKCSVADGIMNPEGTLMLASDGLLYGTAALGGASGAGAVFRMSPDGSGFTIIRQFGTTVDDARQPNAGLMEAADGSLLGTSFAGGTANLGTVFKLNKDGSGFQTLRNFTGSAADGFRSRSSLVQGAPGIFYSATLNGGTAGLGTVFQLAIPYLAMPPR